MLTNVTHSSTTTCVNSVVDSLYLRVLRQCIPSNWLKEQIPKWRHFQETADYDTEPFMVFIPRLGTFELKAFGKKPYRFVLRNKDIATVYIWNPDSWETAVSSQTGQFLVDFRSKYLQSVGVEGAADFVKRLCKTFCVTLLCDQPFGWERISRVDLATDTQLAIAPTWADLPRYVSRARKKEGDAESHESELKHAKALLKRLESEAPPRGNKGGATYRLEPEELEILQRAVATADAQKWDENHVYRVMYSRELQSVYFGRFASALHAIRYDKLASLDVQKKQYLKDVWRANGWDGQSPVWRTEFRLTAPFLKQAGLLLETGERLQDLRDFKVFCRYIPHVWQYLTCEWLRLTVPNETDSNQWRWQIDPEWEVVQRAFPDAEAIKRYPELKNPVDAQMVAQMRGVALTLVARRAEWDGDYEAAIDVLNDLSTWFAEENFSKRLAERRELLGCDDFTHAAIAHQLRSEHLLDGEGS